LSSALEEARKLGGREARRLGSLEAGKLERESAPIF
jgi:hypothetical protein